LQAEVHPVAAEQLPATTWPLGEILSARHDLLHSRIFNS
jgi:urease accessory protein